MVTAKTDDQALREALDNSTGNLTLREFVPRSDLVEMHESEHFVQFYETDEFLLHTLSGFIATGIHAGEAAMVVATRAHREALEQRLQACGLDVVNIRASGQFVVLDAAETLAMFMADGFPNAARFTQIIGSMIAQAAHGRNGIRIFGEMVALLWAEEQYDAAIGLEALWNNLRETHAFTLFCAYPINSFDGIALAKPLRDVCAEHSHIIPAESYTELASPDERLRAIIFLQQKARLLQAEILERQAVEERLRASEIRYRRLFEASNDAILILDSTTRKITDANPSAHKLLGFRHEELLGKELWEIGLIADWVSNLQAFQTLREQQMLHYEHVPFRTNDGQHRDLECVSTMYQANGNQVIQWNIRDISKRKQAEAALSVVKDELEIQVEDLRRLHEMSLSLTSTLDIDSVLREVLRAALDLHGTSLGLLWLCDPQREGLSLKVSSGFDAAFLEHIALLPSGGSACGTCYEQRRRIVVEDVESDSSFDAYRETIRVAGFRACHSTPLITRSDTLIGVLSVHFGMPHRPSGRETRLMDLYARMAADFIENARLHHQIQQELAEREQILIREHKARAEAESANRMKDEFLATVSHELRTPLTPIIAWAQRLRRAKLDETTVIRGLEVIERSAKSQAQLIEDILDVSRVIAGKLRLSIEPVDAAVIINAAIDSVQSAADAKHIQLAVTLDPSGRHILGDSQRLQQVIWNLLSNAIKFTPTGGRVDVRLERSDATSLISVSDTGEGISADFLPFIFDRFRQADSTSTRRHSGLGLGLAIVRHLVELHGGTVQADSPGVGYGAVFTVRIPLAVADQRAKSQSRALESVDVSAQISGQIEPLPSLDGVQVLLVDDDADTLQILKVMLMEHKARVQVAASTVQALDVLQWYKPDVLVSDLAMPDEDGYSLIAKVRAREAKSGKHTPAIALTASVHIEDRARAVAAGFNMFLPKPVETSELITAIARLIESGATKFVRA